MNSRSKFRFINHWEHWRSHIIVIGVEPAIYRFVEPKWQEKGLEFTIFGFGFQFFNTRFINYLLKKIWKVL